MRDLARIRPRPWHGRGGDSPPGAHRGITKAAEAPPRPELERLARGAGTWNVTMTMRPSADAEPIVVTGLVAERTAIGPYLQEIMTPAAGSGVSDFARIDYLTYNPLQARWQYLSMDTRATVGLMYAQGPGSPDGDSITVYFADSPGPSELGPAVAGRFMSARHVLTRETDDREQVRQYWTITGSPEWLAVRSEYTRKAATP